MTVLIDSILLFIAVVVSLPSLILFVEILAAFFPGNRIPSPVGFPRSKSISVIVPAHNESSGIARTLLDISGQLAARDSLVVVADNCTDDTATVATSCGANVVIRQDEARRGKGYALAFGLDYIATIQPDIVIIIDADCRVSPGTVDTLAAIVTASNRPVQSLNLMKPPSGHERRFAVAQFAWIIRNKVRPSGLSILGLPCQLMGTGMAFPWEVIRSVDLGSSNIVEDLELGINLACIGSSPMFCTEAVITSEFPLTEEGVIKQRQRWEQGSLHMLLKTGLKTICTAITQQNGSLLVLGLDMLVPPLVLQVFANVLVITTIGTLYFIGIGGVLPLAIAGTAGVLIGVSLVLSWLAFGRDALPARQLIYVIPYLLAKLKIYKGFRADCLTEWIRSDRTKEN